MKRTYMVILALLSLTFMSDTAEARRHRVRHAQPSTTWEMSNPMFATPVFQEPTHATRVRGSRYAASSAQIIPHPSGCPRRAFCGCGLAVSIFGSPVRDLWLAANWFKFPRTSPAPGMVGVRSHHVFKLVNQTSRGTWIVEDYNSGGGLSRIHERSIAGYTIVNPRA